MTSAFSFDFSSLIWALLAVAPLAQGWVSLKKGRPWPWAALSFLAIPLFFILKTFGGEAGMLENAAFGLRDLSLALIIASAYVSLRKVFPGMFLVFGLLGMIGFGVLYFIPKGISDLFSSSATDTTEVNSDSGLQQFLVELGPDDNIDELSDILNSHSATAEQAFPMVTLAENEDLAQYYLLTFPAAETEGLSADLKADTENVDFFSTNPELSAIPVLESTGNTTPRGKLPTNDPRLNEQWALHQTSGLQALEYLKSHGPSRKAKLAILDTGIDTEHADIKGAATHTSTDQQGHGTHCAGIAAAIADNGQGIASFNLNGDFIDVRSYPALSSSGSGTMERIAEQIIQAAEDKNDVISMSLGGPSLLEANRVLKLAVDYARQLGSIVVVAAGNSSRPASSYVPAGVDGVICVSAIDSDRLPTSFTNTTEGLSMPVAAPGKDILSLKPGSEYVSLSGTSMACPYVAGIISVMRAINPSLTTETAWKILNETGDAHEAEGKIGRIINVEKAFKAARSI